jgi:hypothetical protein
VALGRSDDAGKFMQRIVELQPGAAEVANLYFSAKDPEYMQFVVTYILLREPNLESAVQYAHDDTNFGRPHYSMTDLYSRLQCYDFRERSGVRKEPIFSSFLSAEQKAVGEAEWKQIRAKVLWAPENLGKIALDWALKHPDDPRVPEALHRVVLSAFFRCGDVAKGKYSKAAFELLHKQYPKSPWTEKTPYWYN